LAYFNDITNVRKNVIIVNKRTAIFITYLLFLHQLHNLKT